jgi:addiction module HigA family antidote
MRNPPHPGAFIRTEILQPLELSVTDAAKALGVSRVALSSLLNAQADLSGDMALRIEKAFGVRMETLMRMQSSYDMVQTRQRAKLITVRRYRGAVAPKLTLEEQNRATSVPGGLERVSTKGRKVRRWSLSAIPENERKRARNQQRHAASVQAEKEAGRLGSPPAHIIPGGRPESKRRKH